MIRRGQVTAEFLLAFAVLLVFISLVVAGIGQLEGAERELGGSISDKMGAEEAASALWAGCVAGRASAEIPLHRAAEGGKVVVGNSSARILDCGGMEGEPV